MRQLSPKALFSIALGCAITALVVLPAIGGEEGTGADIAFIAQLLFVLAGISALVLAIRAVRAARV